MADRQAEDLLWSKLDTVGVSSGGLFRWPRAVLATQPMNLDPDHYHDPERFDAFRFSRSMQTLGVDKPTSENQKLSSGGDSDGERREKQEQQRDLMVTLSPSFLAFGYGQARLSGPVVCCPDAETIVGLPGHELRRGTGGICVQEQGTSEHGDSADWGEAEVSEEGAQCVSGCWGLISVYYWETITSRYYSFDKIPFFTLRSVISSTFCTLLVKTVSHPTNTSEHSVR